MTANAGDIWTVALYPETAFPNGPVEDSSTWDSDGSVIEFYCIEPNPSNLRQGVVNDRNYVQRLLEQHTMRRGLKSGVSVPFGLYCHGHATGVAEGAQIAAQDYQSQLLKNYMGGQNLGYAAGLAGGTATNPETEVGEAANMVASQFGFFTDATDGTGEFVPIDSTATDVLTTRWDIPFTPDGTGADSVWAVEDNFYDQDALVNNGDANYVTHSLFFKGGSAEQLWEANGCKLTLSDIEGLAAGEEPVMRFEALVTTFKHETLSEPTLSGTVQGSAPPTTGTGTATIVKFGDKGSAPVAIEESSVSISGFVQRKAWGGPSGTEGIHGYDIATPGDLIIELTVPFDDDYATDFRAGTEKHLLVQIGNTPGDAIGFYFARLEYAEDPQHGVDEERATVTLRLRALEYDASTAKTGDALEQWRSKMHYLRSAASA